MANEKLECAILINLKIFENLICRDLLSYKVINNLKTN